MTWFPRDKTCKHKLGFYYLKEFRKYKGRQLSMFYCPLCLAMTIKLNDLDDKEIIKSYESFNKNEINKAKKAIY